ncbi:MAG: YraN family protein [Oscillospiraceae bacterium]
MQQRFELDTGAMGEHTAELYLRMRGWAILARNFKCRFGEIDIIAENASFIAFVEVKTRAKNALVSGEEAVDLRKQSRLTVTAELYLSQNPSNLQPRFDVVIVERDGREFRVVNYIENAF